MKKIWITSLTHDQNNVKYLMELLKPYRVNAEGHFWIDDLKQMAWASAKDAINENTGLWIIITDNISLQQNTILKGLSAFALMIQAIKSVGLPILILTTDNEFNQPSLPSPLKSAQILPFKIAGLGAKIVALLNLPATKQEIGYRVNLHPLHELGLWIEIGPTTSTWDGIMFGTNGCQIDFQAQGNIGSLPEHCTLEYPQQGLKIKLAETEFSAWSIKNKINTQTSYFARVNELPDQILFGMYSNHDDAYAYVIKFC